MRAATVAAPVIGALTLVGMGVAPSLAAGACPNEAVRSFQHSDVYLGECRALELVNNPDKGNQNALAQGTEMGDPPLTPDGGTALWSVTGGAPGGPSGFL